MLSDFTEITLTQLHMIPLPQYQLRHSQTLKGVIK